MEIGAVEDAEAMIHDTRRRMRAGGIERIVEIKFTPQERAAFRKSVKAVENLVAITKKLQRESKKKR